MRTTGWCTLSSSPVPLHTICIQPNLPKPPTSKKRAHVHTFKRPKVQIPEPVRDRRRIHDAHLAGGGGFGGGEESGEEELGQVEVPEDVGPELEVVAVGGDLLDWGGHYAARCDM